MSECKCEHCDQPFSPRQSDQRFCCRECSTAWWQTQRRLAMELYRQQQREQQRQSA
jgi:hypothetical protein